MKTSNQAKALSKSIYSVIRTAYGSSDINGLSVRSPGIDPAAVLLLSQQLRELKALVGTGIQVKVFILHDDEPVPALEPSEQVNEDIITRRMNACYEMLERSLRRYERAYKLGDGTTLTTQSSDPAQSKRCSDIRGVMRETGLGQPNDEVLSVILRITEAKPNPDLYDTETNKDYADLYAIDASFVDRVNEELESDERFGRCAE